jgi:hypothetical protein
MFKSLKKRINKVSSNIASSTSSRHGVTKSESSPESNRTEQPGSSSTLGSNAHARPSSSSHRGTNPALAQSQLTSKGASTSKPSHSISRFTSSSSSNSQKKKDAAAAAEAAAWTTKDLIAKVEHLSKFDACIEAADALAAAAGHRVGPFSRIDATTGLHDCSVLVSPDGNLLLVPQGEHQTLYKTQRPSTPPPASTTLTDNTNNHLTNTNDVAPVTSDDGSGSSVDLNPNDESTLEPPLPPPQVQVAVEQEKPSAVSELLLTNKTDYESAVFLGNDLHPAGDKALNGFSAKGWSVPATSLALQQSEQCLQDLSLFCEDMVLNRKEAAARASGACDNLRMAHPAMGGGTVGTARQQQYQQAFSNDWEIIDPKASDFEMTPHRVGPLLSGGGTLSGALLALEHYYSIMAENEADRWRSASLQRQGLLPALQKATNELTGRISQRQQGLEESSRRARIMEDRLRGLKDDATKKWQAVYQAEDMVTMRVEEIMQQRSRERESRRLDQLREEEAKQSKDSANGVLGATSEEIWDIVSAVAESMDNGSFEPLDMPLAPLSTPRDKSMAESSPSISAANSTDTKDSASVESIPLASRENIEHEVGLPELRAAAMAADEAVEDASGSLLNIISNLDTTRRSARIAAETCLVSASHAQAECIRSMIQLERDGLEDRLRHLKELELMAGSIDVRADLDAYITLDKKDRGGISHLGDDDDGGVASALAVLSSHVDGNMGLAPVRTIQTDTGGEKEKEDTTTPEMIEKAIEALFEDNKLLHQDTPESPESIKTRLEFETSMNSVCNVASDNSPSARAKRSSICYFLNSKRSSNAEIKSPIQFDALCRVFAAILTGCNSEEGGVSNAKMCMMLAQTFYIVKKGDDGDGDGNCDGDAQADGRSQRVYSKSRLSDHELWSRDDFW